MVFSGRVCKGCEGIGTFVIAVDIATGGWTGAIPDMLRNAGDCNSDTQHKVLGKIRFDGSINPLMPSGHYMYHRFKIQQFYVLPTQCIYAFCVDLRANSDYFSIQH